MSMLSEYMNLKILLPFRVFAEKAGVLQIIVGTSGGSFGLLPHRLDCVVSLVPGIMILETEAEGEIFFAVDEGVLVKAGTNVLVSVRNAIGEMALDKLREEVEKEFLKLDEQEENMRSVMMKLEGGIIRRFVALHHE